MVKIWVWEENVIQKASFLRTIEKAGFEVNGCSNIDDAVRLCRSGQVDVLLIDTVLHGETWALEAVDVLRRYAVRVGNALHPHIGLLVVGNPELPFSSSAFRMHVPLIKKNDWADIAHWLDVFENMVREDEKDELLLTIFHT